MHRALRPEGRRETRAGRSVARFIAYVYVGLHSGLKQYVSRSTYDFDVRTVPASHPRPTSHVAPGPTCSPTTGRGQHRPPLRHRHRLEDIAILPASHLETCICSDCQLEPLESTPLASLEKKQRSHQNARNFRKSSSEAINVLTAVLVIGKRRQ